jgi:hypothetical protein
MQDDKNALWVVKVLSAGAMPFQVAAQLFMVLALAVMTIIGEDRKPAAAKASKAVLIFMG